MIRPPDDDDFDGKEEVECDDVDQLEHVVLEDLVVSVVNDDTEGSRVLKLLICRREIEAPVLSLRWLLRILFFGHEDEDDDFAADCEGSGGGVPNAKRSIVPAILVIGKAHLPCRGYRGDDVLRLQEVSPEDDGINLEADAEENDCRRCCCLTCGPLRPGRERL